MRVAAGDQARNSFSTERARALLYYPDFCRFLFVFASLHAACSVVEQRRAGPFGRAVCLVPTLPPFRGSWGGLRGRSWGCLAVALLSLGRTTVARMCSRSVATPVARRSCSSVLIAAAVRLLRPALSRGRADGVSDAPALPCIGRGARVAWFVGDAPTCWPLSSSWLLRMPCACVAAGRSRRQRAPSGCAVRRLCWHRVLALGRAACACWLVAGGDAPCSPARAASIVVLAAAAAVAAPAARRTDQHGPRTSSSLTICPTYLEFGTLLRECTYSFLPYGRRDPGSSFPQVTRGRAGCRSGLVTRACSGRTTVCSKTRRAFTDVEHRWRPINSPSGRGLELDMCGLPGAKFCSSEFCPGCATAHVLPRCAIPFAARKVQLGLPHSECSDVCVLV